MTKNTLKIIALLVSIYLLAACSDDNASTAQVAKTGEDIYYQSCFSCHERGHGGAPKRGDMSAWQSRVEKGQEALMQNMLRGYRAMPPKGACFSCSDQELQMALDFMLEPVETP